MQRAVLTKMPIFTIVLVIFSNLVGKTFDSCYMEYYTLVLANRYSYLWFL